MHTTASSLVVIAQYFWRIRTSLLYGNQQKFNIEAVNDYPPIWFEIRTEILQVSSLIICKLVVRYIPMYQPVRWDFSGAM